MSDKKLVIEPLDNIVYFEPASLSIAGLDTSSVQVAIEYAKVIAVGKNVTNVNVGDHIFVKSWAPDSIFWEGRRYSFVNVELNAILAIVREK